MEHPTDDGGNPFAARTRMAYKPGVLRSLDVRLDVDGPFIDAVSL
jgi:hypothetical protein